jgi:hypothetical protein
MSGFVMPTYRAPPEVTLAKIQVFLAEDAAAGAERTKIDIHLVIALLRFALTHGATTVGDLQMPNNERVRVNLQGRTMLNRADRFSGLEGVAGPAVTGPAHSERDAAYCSGVHYASDHWNHARRCALAR